MARSMTTAATAAAMVLAQLVPALPAVAQAQGGNWGGGWQGGSYPGGDAQLLRCESSGGAYRECPFPAGVTRVQLARQLSSQQCVEGRTWGQRGQFGGGAIWVSNGCRAEFALIGQGGYPGGGYPGGGYPGGGYPGGGWQGGNAQGFAGRIACNSNDRRDRFCPVNTQGRVEVLRLNGGECVQGRDWTFDARGISVRNGCRAQFGYGYAAGYPGGGYPGGPGYPGNQYPGGQQGGFAGTRDCESRNYRPETCQVNTQGRVQLLRLEGGQCRQGQDWNFDNRAIYVRNGCRARFGYGYGNESGEGGGGIGAGGIIAGAAVAAGLIALLASRGKRDAGQVSANPSANASATLIADESRFAPDARADGRACLAEAARQVGSTGGTRVTLERVDGVIREGASRRITAILSGVYDGRSQPLTMVCTAQNGRVTGFDVR